jgi:hypothetical protein
MKKITPHHYLMMPASQEFELWKIAAKLSCETPLFLFEKQLTIR